MKVGELKKWLDDNCISDDAEVLVNERQWSGDTEIEPAEAGKQSNGDVLFE